MNSPTGDEQQDSIRVGRADTSGLGPVPGGSRRQGRTVGAMLRAEREGLGVELEQVAQQLRIRYPYLVAIEDGNYEALPGPTYVVGFVRTYAEYLGLDPQDVIQRFRREASGLDARPDLTFPVPVTRRSVPGGAILVTACILAVCGYGTWYYLSTSERPRQEQVAAVPSRLLDLMPEAAKSPADPPSPTDPPPASPLPAPTSAALSAASVPSNSGRSPNGTTPATAMVSPAPRTLPNAGDQGAGIGGRPSTNAGRGANEASVTPGGPSSPGLIASPPSPRASGGTNAQSVQPGFSQPVSGQPGSGPPSFVQPGFGQPPAGRGAQATATAAAPGHELTPAELNQQQLDLLDGRPGLRPAAGSATPHSSAVDAATASGRNGLVGSGTVSEPTTQSLNQQQLSQVTPTSARPLAPSQATQSQTTQTSFTTPGSPGSRITIHANADSWVQLTDGNQRVFARLLKAGETLRIPDKSGMTLRTGNAGGLDIAVDGRSIQPLGPAGSVKQVALQPGSLINPDAGQE